jgi:hypothetical protein
MALIDIHRKSSIAGPIIVMALSIVAVVILWATFGHIGPTFSSDVMTLQRAKLRHRLSQIDATGTDYHKSKNTADPAF